MRSIVWFAAAVFFASGFTTRHVLDYKFGPSSDEISHAEFMFMARDVSFERRFKSCVSDLNKTNEVMLVELRSSNKIIRECMDALDAK